MVLNFQPVMPFRLNDDYNIITRPIIPYVNVPLLFGESEGGFGDVQMQVYLAPAKGNLIWGIGPSFSVPTALIGRSEVLQEVRHRCERVVVDIEVQHRFRLLDHSLECPMEDRPDRR